MIAGDDVLYGWIAAYAAHGLHRTGSPGDEATSRWLVDRLKACGIAAVQAPYSFPRLVWREAALFVGHARIEGTPLYDAGTTGPEGTVGSFPVLEDPDPAALAALLDEPGDAAGVIVVTGDPEGYVRLLNAERLDRPWRVPALQVARRDAGPLLDAARAGAAMKLVVDCERTEGTAGNVVADIPAAGAAQTVVLMTPKTGWFGCAAERGGGIAIALALAQAAAAMPGRRRNLRVLFTGGHELGHRGLLGYLAQNPGLRESAAFWLQLGASIGARDAANMRVFTREEPLRGWFMEALARHGAGPVALAARDLRPHGESREVFDRPFLSLAGRHPSFHSPRDLPERTVDAASVARYARAFLDLLERLLR